ncbi:MAG: SBBP repeat-containing protein [Thaumarchaeota archaeon]|nr:SBBP repeat-containing protein [Nitrososphaerota archaeon]
MERKITLVVFMMATIISLVGLGLSQQAFAKSAPFGLSEDQPFSQQSDITDEVKAQIFETYGKLPLNFEANYGQTDNQVSFLSKGSGYILFLTPREAVFSLIKQAEQNDNQQSSEFVVIRMQMLDANDSPKISGVDELPNKSNYFIGNDPEKWYTDIPNYKKVMYQDIYQDIDLIFYGNQRQLEYDFVVMPNADPSVIKLGFEGVDKLTIDKDGNLILHINNDKIIQHAPVIYQEYDGVKKNVSGKYVLNNNDQVGFDISTYNSELPLVIDPVLIYSTYLGGSGIDEGNDIAVDSSGNAYVTGETFSSDFPLTNPIDGTKGIGSDAFVTKINSAGDALVYSTYLGGSTSIDGFSFSDSGEGIAVDSSGNVYVVGVTFTDDFPTMNPIDGTIDGITDTFVTKINSAGNALVYSTYLGGNSIDNGSDIAVDSSGNAYVTGTTFSSNFPTKFPIQGTSGGVDAFVTKFNSAGSAHVYSTYLGGCNSESGNGIAVDSSGNAYVTGNTASDGMLCPTVFPTTNPIQGTHGGGFADAFVTKFNSAGDAHVYSTFLGGSSSDTGNDIAVDSSGNAYVTGTTSSSDFPTTNPIDGTLNSQDAFVTKINSAGDAHVYSTYLGGSSGDSGGSIAVDSSGNAYVTGETSSSDFPTTNPIQGTFGGGTTDTFVTKINSAGDAHVYSTFLGGSSRDVGHGIAVDSSENAYVIGETQSTNFPTKFPIQGTKGSGFQPDAFVTKIGDDIVIGGINIPIDQSALLLAGAQSISMWMIPVVVAGIGIGIFVIKRRK